MQSSIPDKTFHDEDFVKTNKNAVRVLSMVDCNKFMKFDYLLFDQQTWYVKRQHQPSVRKSNCFTQMPYRVAKFCFSHNNKLCF